MMDWLVKRPATTPDCCVFAIGIPTSPATFRRKRTEPESFAGHFRGGWLQYESTVMRPLVALVDTLRRWDVPVEPALSLERFARLFEERQVVILFSHWGEYSRSIEFEEGMIAGEDVAESVPAQFRGTLDLCVCHPSRVVAQVDVRCPDCEIVYADCKLTCDVWMGYYMAVFAALRSGLRPYGEAARAVAHEFRIQLRRGAI